MTVKYVLLDMNTGEFSNSWTEEEMALAKEKGWKRETVRTPSRFNPKTIKEGPKQRVIALELGAGYRW